MPSISRIIPESCSFKLIEWEFPDVFKWIQAESNMTKEEMLSIFNCGYGYGFSIRKLIDISEQIFYKKLISKNRESELRNEILGYRKKLENVVYEIKKNNIPFDHLSFNDKKIY